ncbi:serine hydrolase [Motilimonas sp. 1_MG-2023]|uniref:serine hydrolase domain-containing protein n=1 Tax=Motilimonas sp. 1_MG-2023 TaxID=3062672 RepID=UPI0026E2FDE8|nr:serine hydrolase [Motilimonas sp. 1_MG-2023]MDO6525220.1 serine hydrolase [Motilimonas sp. 1_MG-2023]
MKYAYLALLLLVTSCANTPQQVYNSSPIFIDFDGTKLGGVTQGDIFEQIIPQVHDILSPAQKRALNHYTDYASRDNSHALGGMVVYHKGVPVYSWFDSANGAKSDQPYQSNSLTKSVTSLLLGIAIDQGYIASVDDPISRYLNDYRDDLSGNKAKLTIRDLLTMTDAIEWNQNPYNKDGSLATDNSPNEMFRSSNPTHYIVSRPENKNAKGQFTYGEWQPFLIGQIIQNATGQDFFTFANKNLFTPMDITYWHWHTLRDDSPNTNGGVYLNVWDRAKLGQLVISQGKWQDKQLVSKNWIKASTKNQLAEPGSAWAASSYGYYWWLDNLKIGKSSINTISAEGWGGNSIIIYPERDLVIATMGGDYRMNSMAAHGIGSINERLAKFVVSRYFPIQE